MCFPRSKYILHCLRWLSFQRRVPRWKWKLFLLSNFTSSSTKNGVTLCDERVLDLDTQTASKRLQFDFKSFSHSCPLDACGCNVIQWRSATQSKWNQGEWETLCNVSHCQNYQFQTDNVGSLFNCVTASQLAPIGPAQFPPSSSGNIKFN